MECPSVMKPRFSITRVCVCVWKVTLRWRQMECRSSCGNDSCWITLLLMNGFDRLQEVVCFPFQKVLRFGLKKRVCPLFAVWELLLQSIHCCCLFSFGTEHGRVRVWGLMGLQAYGLESHGKYEIFDDDASSRFLNQLVCTLEIWNAIYIYF